MVRRGEGSLLGWGASGTGNGVKYENFKFGHLWDQTMGDHIQTVGINFSPSEALLNKCSATSYGYLEWFISMPIVVVGMTTSLSPSAVLCEGAMGSSSLLPFSSSCSSPLALGQQQQNGALDSVSTLLYLFCKARSLQMRCG